METNDLIERLVADLRPVNRRRTEQLVAGAMILSLLASLVLLGVWLGFRPDLPHIAASPRLWSKLAYAGAIAAAAAALTCRLARPVASTGDLWPLAAAPFLIAAVWAIHDLTTASAPLRWRLVVGRSWTECPVRILVLALPGLAALLWVLRRQAPTQPRQAGFAAGLAAGALAAGVYSLHCREDSVPFLAVWYALGMLASAALGSLLAPRWLRW